VDVDENELCGSAGLIGSDNSVLCSIRDMVYSSEMSALIEGQTLSTDLYDRQNLSIAPSNRPRLRGRE
jgi:hypothetical protein